MFKLRKFYNLFWLSETYNSSKINSTHKDNFLLKNMYRLLKTSQTSKAQKKIDKIQHIYWLVNMDWHCLCRVSNGILLSDSPLCKTDNR